MFPQFFRSMLVVAVLTLSLPLVGFAAQQTTAAIPNELLVFDINRPITTADRGFPRNDPPRPEANGDWTNPINFAEGTLYIRVAVRSQPKAQAMRLQFCIWQDNFKLESCAPLADVSGTPGTVVTWSRAIPEMWVKNKPIDWSRPRQRYGFAIKNSQNQPVSDYSGWNWNGENPNNWYPLDARLTVVVVAKGQTFSGWHNYVDDAPVPTATTAAPPTATPVPQPSATATATASPTAVTPPTNTPPATVTQSATPSPSPSATATLIATSTAVATAPATPTLIPTATAPAAGSDAYEPNDSCDQANSIATDATQQAHTVHQPTDIDWVRFDAIAHTDYRIRLITDSALEATVVMECSDTAALSASAVTAPEMRIDFHAPVTGPAYIRIAPKDPSRSGGATEYALAVRQMATTVDATDVVFLPLVIR
ncbi:MAG: hypothetical protein KDE58_29570 [Caldilineaceae bacterium]|nr:hypothetical protein [Caldilineaceae bacterium]